MGLNEFILLLFVINVKANEDCKTGNDCDMTGSICEKGSCVCPPGYIADSLNIKCLEVAEGYGSNCADNIQCSTSLQSGGICSNGSCVCSEGYHYYLGKCWKSAGLGEACKHSENCFVSYDFEAAICNSKKKCECSDGYYQREYSSCRRKSYKPGDPCGIALDCQFKDAVCTTDRKCGNKTSTDFHDTTAHAVRLQNLGAVVLSSKVGDNCTATTQCPKNAECNQRMVCSCKQGFFLENNNCNPELGASCSGDSDCVGKNTMCRDGKYCVCKQGFVAAQSSQYCDKMSRYLGWSCLNDRECGFFGPGSVCSTKKCHCDNATHYVENEMYCWATKYIEDSCISNEDCGGVDTMVCSGGACHCSTNTHASSNKRVCRGDGKGIGDKCEENLDCIFDNSFCNVSSHSCQCGKGYVDVNDSCVAGVGGQCNIANDCHTEGTDCVKGMCVCQQNYVGSRDFKACLPIIHEFHGNCSESVQCKQIDGICSEGKCSCKNGYHYVEGAKCFKSRFIDQSCTSAGECDIVKNAVCLKGTCDCRPGCARTTSSRGGVVCSSGSHAEISWLSLIILSTIYIKCEI